MARSEPLVFELTLRWLPKAVEPTDPVRPPLLDRVRARSATRPKRDEGRYVDPEGAGPRGERSELLIK